MRGKFEAHYEEKLTRFTTSWALFKLLYSLGATRGGGGITDSLSSFSPDLPQQMGIPLGIATPHKFFSVYLITPRNKSLGRLEQFLDPMFTRCTFTGPYSTGFWLQEYPLGFTACPYTRAGVAFPLGMPICRGRSRVKTKGPAIIPRDCPGEYSSV